MRSALPRNELALRSQGVGHVTTIHQGVDTELFEPSGRFCATETPPVVQVPACFNTVPIPPFFSYFLVDFDEIIPRTQRL